MMRRQRPGTSPTRAGLIKRERVEPPNPGLLRVGTQEVEKGNS